MQKYLVVFLLFIAARSSAQFFYHPFPPGKEDFKRTEKAGVKICYEYKTEAGEKYLNSILEYGGQGLPAAWYVKGLNEEGDSATLSETIYKYNKDLNIASTSTEDFEEGFKSVTAFTYGPGNRLTKKEVATIDPPTYYYSYDAANRLKEIKMTIKLPAYDDEGNFTGKSFERPQARMTYTCDAKNRVIEERYFLPDENGKYPVKPDRKTKWSYNSLNQVVKLVQFDNEGSEMLTITMEYNKQGLLFRFVKKDLTADESEEYIYEYCTDCKQSWMQ